MRLRLALATALFLAPQPVLPLDLTPHAGFRELEGIQIPIIEFADGAGKVTFQPPTGWKCEGGPRLLRLTPPDPGERRVEIRLDAATEPDLDRWCRKLLPVLATRIALAAEAASPFTLRALPGRENTYTYAYQSRLCTTSIACVELSPGQRLALVVTASPENFKATHEAAVRALFSFDWPKATAPR